MTSTFSVGSTAAAFAQRRDGLVDLRTRLDEANRELSTGRKGDVYRALGPNAVELHRLRDDAARIERQVEDNTLLASRLDVTAKALVGSTDVLRDFLAIAAPNRDGPGPTVSALRDAARSTYDALVSQLNTSFGGTFLFSGVDTDRAPLQPWEDASATTGLSPRDVLDGIVGGGLTTGADAAAKAAEVAASFEGTNGLTPDRNFERSFFSGTPAEDGFGNPSQRMRASIDQSISLTYGVQANDPAFRSALQGLAMIAAIDPETIDADAYAEWITTGIDATVTGLDGVRDAQTRLGSQQAMLQQVTDRQDVRGDLFAVQISRLEGVDPYEAATRVSMLSTQLEASFASTASLMRLSFLNYM